MTESHRLKANYDAATGRFSLAACWAVLEARGV
jgi:hypothetical protein